MAMNETQRTTLHDQLTNAIGQEAARILMDQLPPSGWDQIASKEDVKASEARLQRHVQAGEKSLRGELNVTKGQLMVKIAASESRQGGRIDNANARIDKVNARIN